MDIRSAGTTIKQVELPSGTIRYREWGSGEPIVFVHGLLVNGTLWQRLVPLLAPRFRCIVPDWPLGAHAIPMRARADLSPPGLARLIVEFLAALGLEDVTLVGNDTGGALCQLAITADPEAPTALPGRPERIARLVLTNCDAFDQFLPWQIRPLQWTGYLPGFALLYGQLLRVHSWRKVTVLLGLLCKHPVERELLDGWFAPLQTSHGVRRDLHKVLRGISARYTLAAAKRFPALQQPVLLAWAPEDYVFKANFARRLQAAFSDARLELVHDSLTFVPLDQPRRLAELVEAFVNEDASIAVV